MHKFATGALKSQGKKVNDRKQAIAIMLSEKRESSHKTEYRPAGKKKGLEGYGKK